MAPVRDEALQILRRYWLFRRDIGKIPADLLDLFFSSNLFHATHLGALQRKKCKKENKDIIGMMLSCVYAPNDPVRTKVD